MARRSDLQKLADGVVKCDLSIAMLDKNRAKFVARRAELVAKAKALADSLKKLTQPNADDAAVQVGE